MDLAIFIDIAGLIIYVIATNCPLPLLWMAWHLPSAWTIAARNRAITAWYQQRSGVIANWRAVRPWPLRPQSLVLPLALFAAGSTITYITFDQIADTVPQLVEACTIVVAAMISAAGWVIIAWFIKQGHRRMRLS